MQRKRSGIHRTISRTLAAAVLKTRSCRIDSRPLAPCALTCCACRVPPTLTEIRSKPSSPESPPSTRPRRDCPKPFQIPVAIPPGDDADLRASAAWRIYGAVLPASAVCPPRTAYCMSHPAGRGRLAIAHCLGHLARRRGTAMQCQGPNVQRSPRIECLFARSTALCQKIRIAKT